MQHGITVVALVGGHLLRYADGEFRTSTFDDYDNPYGMFGDRIRGEAAAALYHRNPLDTSIMVLGGVTPLHKTVPDASHLSTVIKRELIMFGVPGEAIEEVDLDPFCGTYAQLAYLGLRIRKASQISEIRELAVLSNFWQLPRIFSMVCFSDELADVLLRDRPRVRFVAAEDVITDVEPRRYAEIVAAYRRPEMRSCIKRELRGASMIAEGTYVFPTNFPDR